MVPVLLVLHVAQARLKAFRRTKQQGRQLCGALENSLVGLILALLFNSKVSTKLIWLVMRSFATAASNSDGRNNSNKSNGTHDL